MLSAARRQIITPSLLLWLSLLVPTSALMSAPQSASGTDPFPDINATLFTDVRLALSDSEVSWLDDAQGKGRYGNSNTDLELAETSLIIEADFDWQWQGFSQLKYDPEQKQALDVVEAYVSYKPVPTDNIQYRFRAGLLFPHISRENRGIAWTTPFTITPSAANSWVGEEIRALALEGTATIKSDGQKLSFTAAIFGFNDPAGTILAYRGWAMHDVKVGAFSRLPLPPVSSIGSPGSFSDQQPLWVNPVREIDNQPGFYGAIDWSLDPQHKLGIFYYDNRGDPNVIKRNQYAWDTRFWNIYAEKKMPGRLILIAQYMTGRTEMGPKTAGIRQVDVDFSAGYLLASKAIGKHRVSLRRDWFDSDDNSFVIEDNNDETGSAWTFAFSTKLNKQHRIIAELMQIDSRRPNRVDIGVEPEQTQTQFQLSYRAEF